MIRPSRRVGQLSKAAAIFLALLSFLPAPALAQEPVAEDPVSDSAGVEDPVAETAGAEAAGAEDAVNILGNIQPTVWIDPDGCVHWVADGGTEGYMEGRVNPEDGMPICLDLDICSASYSDLLFQSGSADLTASGRASLEEFFLSAGAFAYAIYGHTDSRGSDEFNMRLSQNRASAVAEVARSVGARVAREIGYGERRPVASNETEAGMSQNRRVEIVCYR